ncbi:MAG: hypothetical protein V1720_19505 [bacterium]
MFGFWFAFAGLIFGMICSYMAKNKNRHPENWFLLGFAFSILTVAFLYMLPGSGNESEERNSLTSNQSLLGST